MVKLTFRFHHKSDTGTMLYSYGDELEAYFVGVKIHNNKLIIFNVVETDKPLPTEVIAAFQEYLDSKMHELYMMGIVPLIPVVHSAIYTGNTFHISSH